MYKLKHASEVPIRGNVVRTGLPVYDHTLPNIAIVSANNMEPLHLNAVMLRIALLNSPEFVEKYLGLKVENISEKQNASEATETKATQEEQTAKKPSKPKEPKKKVEKKVIETKTSTESEEVNEWM